MTIKKRAGQDQQVNTIFSHLSYYWLDPFFLYFRLWCPFFLRVESTFDFLKRIETGGAGVDIYFPSGFVIPPLLIPFFFGWCQWMVECVSSSSSSLLRAVSRVFEKNPALPLAALPSHLSSSHGRLIIDPLLLKVALYTFRCLYRRLVAVAGRYSSSTNVLIWIFLIAPSL